MRTPLIGHWVAWGALAALIALAGVAAATPVPMPAGGVERAEILPVAQATAGPATGGSGGFAINANGVTDYWSPTTPDVNFIVFVFPTTATTQDIRFTVLAPDGKRRIFTYTFKAQKLALMGNEYTFAAKGDYSKLGIYTAVVDAGGAEIGRVPVVVAGPVK